MLQQQSRQPSEGDRFMSSDKNMANKRRAAFGDITNNSVSTLISGKKQCKPVIHSNSNGTEQLQRMTQQDSKILKVDDTGDQVIDDYHGALQCFGENMPCSVEVDMMEIANDETVLTSLTSISEAEQMDCQLSVVEDLPSQPMNDANQIADTEACDWVDIDKENLHLPSHVALYVNDIFDYYRQRELQYTVSDYLQRQSDITSNMRAILVDWLVEVQQNFELNHETLYTAVKLTDRYIDKQQGLVAKDRLQLIGAAALNIACKFEERSPPVIDDFLYICDDAYTRDELLAMEISILKTIDFDVGIPLSYTFVRRYAQCARVGIPTLTLARYVLETSLMDYTYVNCRESKLAAAALLLAMNMNVEGQWDGTVKHYTGYDVSELTDLACQLNDMIARPQKSGLNTVATKYSHPVFHKVAKIPVLDASELEMLCSSGSSHRKSVTLS